MPVHHMRYADLTTSEIPLLSICTAVYLPFGRSHPEVEQARSSCHTCLWLSYTKQLEVRQVQVPQNLAYSRSTALAMKGSASALQSNNIVEQASTAATETCAHSLSCLLETPVSFCSRGSWRTGRAAGQSICLPHVRVARFGSQDFTA